MGYLSNATLFGLLPFITTAQHATTYTNPAVPTGTPVPGDYRGSLRPQVHFSPPQKFMNDPNGMFVDANGTWHLYYQYNPTAITAGNQHWGHATSQDLYHWINQPIALFPTEEKVYIFSGSAVVDTNNTSGFFPEQDNGVVAIFTLARYNEDGSPGPETQGIAYSLDGGFSFQYYDGNPVIDSNSTQFRDPKVIRYNGHWVMVIAYAEALEIGIFTSPDLKTWTPASNFSKPGVSGVVYECPNLVKMPVRSEIGGSIVGEAWVLAISINPGAPLGGSATEYYTGTFNGTHFTSFTDVALWTDFAKDNYAAQYFNGIPDGRDAINVGWAGNWQYINNVPTGEKEGWRSAMTLPRTNYLVNTKDNGWIMTDGIYQIESIVDTTLKTSSWDGDGSASVDYSGVESNAIYFDVSIAGLDASTLSGSSSLNISFKSPTGETLLSSVDLGDSNAFYVDRGGLRGFSHPEFTPKFRVPNTGNVDSGTWRLQAAVDRTVYELFLGGGLHAGTVLFYPTEPLTSITFTTQGLGSGVTTNVKVSSLKSAWKAMENGDGLVLGNVTNAKRGELGSIFYRYISS